MDNQPPSQQAFAMVMDNHGRSYSGITNTLTFSGNYTGMGWCAQSHSFCYPALFLCGVWEEMVGMGRRRWYGEEEMVWGGGDGMGRRRWCGEEEMVWGGGDGVGRRWYGEEEMVWGGGDGMGRRRWCGRRRWMGRRRWLGRRRWYGGDGGSGEEEMMGMG